MRRKEGKERVKPEPLLYGGEPFTSHISQRHGEVKSS